MSAPTNNCGITSIKYSIFFSSFKIKKSSWQMPRGRIIRGSTSVYFFLAEKTSHSRCKSDENKSPLIRRSKDVNHVVPPFLPAPHGKASLIWSSSNDRSCNGLPGFSYYTLQKIDSKMCFTVNCCLFPPTRDSLKTPNCYSSFRCHLF